MQPGMSLLEQGKVRFLRQGTARQGFQVEKGPVFPLHWIYLMPTDVIFSTNTKMLLVWARCLPRSVGSEPHMPGIIYCECSFLLLQIGYRCP